MHFANCVTLAAVLFTSLYINSELKILRLCSSAEEGFWIVFNLFLNFEQK